MSTNLNSVRIRKKRLKLQNLFGLKGQGIFTDILHYRFKLMITLSFGNMWSCILKQPKLFCVIR